MSENVADPVLVIWAKTHLKGDLGPKLRGLDDLAMNEVSRAMDAAYDRRYWSAVARGLHALPPSDEEISALNQIAFDSAREESRLWHPFLFGREVGYGETDTTH